ncbi:hypothetical protein [Streptomyces fulvorobeus]|uniref:Uncharacterized protein n=1 Tax=Streptomyces fulvorobeus TaxID=284028 RepID=A0A7J0C4W4_9ACTN|nr:hypothetical protein [Streptomyces fulvorobeus]NYE40681.1 hypothetical protein [Streptomyces fulvorobeus]GFM96984.1 hypothetical protein Sfulv_17950 [Streptomyces fulvorobeus]
MPIPAGGIVTAGQLSRMQPRPHYRQAGSPTTISTTAFTAVDGCSVTLTTTAPNAAYTVQANFSYDVMTAVAGVYTKGALFVDGVQQSGEARWTEGTSGSDSGDYDMAGKSWFGILAAAGSHTLDLRCGLSAAGGASIACTGYTDLTVTIYEVV